MGMLRWVGYLALAFMFWRLCSGLYVWGVDTNFFPFFLLYGAALALVLDLL
jgi:hypothetical protein